MKASNESNYFVELSKINVNEHVERKGQFSNLSWPFAVSQLRQFDPTAIWEVKRFAGLPYLATDLGVFVELAVTVQGICLSQIHPVLDSKNRPIPIPTTFDINTSIQRCLVKAITVRRDEEQMQRIRDGWAEFQTYLVSDSPPPLTEKDSALRADAEWSHAAQAYLQAKSAVDAADEVLETARKALVGLARHPREQGAGVSVVRLWKAGNVDYKKVPQLQGVDLSRYRGQGREEVRVTVVK